MLLLLDAPSALVVAEGVAIVLPPFLEASHFNRAELSEVLAGGANARPELSEVFQQAAARGQRRAGWLCLMILDAQATRKRIPRSDIGSSARSRRPHPGAFTHNNAESKTETL